MSLAVGRAAMVRQSAAGSRFGAAAFVCVFPGFWLYHAFVALGFIPPVLRGYSVAIAAMVFPLLALGYARHASGGRASLMDAVFFTVVGAWLLFTASQFLAGATPAIVQSHLGSIPQWLSLYLIARLLDVDDPAFRLVCRISLALMTVVVLTNLSAGSFALESNTVPIEERVSVATYQDFALIYLTTALFCAIQLRATVARAWLYSLAIAVLFMIGARTEFAAVLVAVVILEWCLARRRAAIVVLTLLFALIVGLVLQVLIEVSPENRVVELITRPSDDSSVQERLFMLESALRTIENNPLSGNFASYPPGEYAHNVLSAWVDLGLAGLLVFAFLLIAPLMDLLRQFRSRAREPLYALALTLLLVDVLLLLTAKFLAYGLTPLALGLYARTRAPVPSAATQGASRTT